MPITTDEREDVAISSHLFQEDVIKRLITLVNTLETSISALETSVADLQTRVGRLENPR